MRGLRRVEGINGVGLIVRLPLVGSGILVDKVVIRSLDIVVGKIKLLLGGVCGVRSGIVGLR